MSRARIAVLGGVVLAALVAGAAAVEDGLVVRVFQVHHHSAAEASQAIERMLSPAGSVTVKPVAGKIVVQDRPEVVGRVAEFLKKWDVAPPPRRLALTLLLASNVPPKGRAAGNRVDPELERRVARVFRYRFFRRLGASTVVAAAGDEVEVELGHGYRARFAVRVPGPRTMGFHPGRLPVISDRFRLEPLVLERHEEVDGRQKLTQLLRTAVGLSAGQRAIVGATPSEEAGSALVLIVESLAGEDG